MNPRLKTSKKWTAFPAEYAKQIQNVFNENFAEFLDDAKILIEGRIYSEEILLRVGYHEEGRLSQANFEVSISYSQQEQDAIQRIHNCVDAAASMMMDYLENQGEVDIPYNWKEIPFQGKKIYVQFTTENSSLEAQANALLGVDESDLLNEDASLEEDALSRAEQSEELSPPRDGDDDLVEDDDLDEKDLEEEPKDKGPRMFGGKPSKAKKNKLH